MRERERAKRETERQRTRSEVEDTKTRDRRRQEGSHVTEVPKPWIRGQPPVISHQEKAEEA